MSKFKSVFKAITGGGSKVKIPPMPKIVPPPPAAAPATLASAEVVSAATNQRQRAAGAAASTVGDSGYSGLKTPPKTGNVTLLGE